MKLFTPIHASKQLSSFDYTCFVALLENDCSKCENVINNINWMELNN